MAKRKGTHSKSYNSSATAHRPENYCVYIDYRIDTMEPVYVGCGRYGFRNRMQKLHNEAWMLLYKNIGITTEVVARGLKKWYAEELECEWILRIGKHRLVNKADGVSSTGILSTRTAALKKSIAVKRKWKEGLADAIRRGKQRQKEKNKRNVEPVHSRIRCVETGIVYNTQREAAIAMGLSQGNISRHLRGGLSCVQGYHFLREKRNGPRKPVMCIETNTTYSSISAAAKAFNVNHQSISYACHHLKGTCCGYHWKFV